MRDEIARARDMMASALKLLDDNHGPIEVGAHLDLAIHLLGEFLDEARDFSISNASK